MNIIGLTGKSGSGKSYFASKLGEKLGNSAVIKIDDIFSEVMNEPDIVSKIRDIYGEEVIKNGEVDLDTILSNKEIFNTIYEMIADRIEEAVTRAIKEAEEGKTEKDGTKTDKKENVILDWWGLPKSDLIAKCDYVVYVDVDPDTRLQALQKRETRISQKDIDIRDDVLSVKYDSVKYDLVIQNDHKQETVDEAVKKISREIEIAHDTKYARENGYDFVLVDADPDKGFNYSYLLYMPKTPQNTLIMDCLNDYEDEMQKGQTENIDASEKVLRFFKRKRRKNINSFS